MSSSPANPNRSELDTLLQSVVKVMAISDAPDYEQPWQSAGPEASAGSGCIVATSRGFRVLTNAHCVQNSVFIEVRRYGKSRRCRAEVEAIGHECDLALLVVESDEFFDDTVPIPLGNLPRLSDQVSVCGYPIGGDRLSITQGIVSRIELIRYAQSQRKLLGIQIDAAINSGNSGGPVIKDGSLVGVAFQTLDSAVRVGHMIAAPVVKHFLQDVEDGVYDGFPGLGCVVQPLDSSAHRRFLGLPEDGQDGVLITHVIHGSSASGTLQIGDVILAVDGIEVGCDGTVPLREGELIDFAYLVSERQVGEQLGVRIWRDGTVIDVELMLREPVVLVAEDRYDVDPSFFIFGGLLFAPLTRDYLRTWGDHWWATAPRDLLALYEQGLVTVDRHEPVILQKVFADSCNQGYHDYASLLVKSVQGIRIRSLAHLMDIVLSTEEEYLVIEGEQGSKVVIDRDHAVERHAEILERFGIPYDHSPDLTPSTGAELETETAEASSPPLAPAEDAMAANAASATPASVPPSSPSQS